jgi:hypothetical protein
VLRFGESDTAQRWARRPAVAHRQASNPPAGARVRSRDLTRSSLVPSCLRVLRPGSGPAPPGPWFQPHAPDRYQRVAARREVAGLSGSLMLRRLLRSDGSVSSPVIGAGWFDLRHEVLADQRALRRVAGADLRGVDAAGALLFIACLARRSAASRLSSACFVEAVAICAARRSAELGRRAVGCIDTVTFCLTVIAVSFSISLISADRGTRGSRTCQRRGQGLSRPLGRQP